MLTCHLRAAIALQEPTRLLQHLFYVIHCRRSHMCNKWSIYFVASSILLHMKPHHCTMQQYIPYVSDTLSYVCYYYNVRMNFLYKFKYFGDG